jgi:PAS domain S-box-containing protein
MRSSLQRALQTKAPDQMPVVRYDVAVTDGTFEERYWSAVHKPVLNAAGEVLYIINNSTEVTAQVVAEQQQRALRKIEKNYQLFMQAPVAICIVRGPDHMVELANEELLQILGRSSEIVGKPLFESIPEAIVQGFPELLDRVRSTGEAHYATEHPTTLVIDGKQEERYYNFVYQPYYENRNDKLPSGVFSVAHNVTAQVLARKKLEEVSENLNFRNALLEAQNEVTPEGVLIVDARGEILLHNRRFIEIWNMPQEILDRKDDRAALEHAMTQLVDPQEFWERVTTLFTRHDAPGQEEILFKDGRVINRIGTPIIARDGQYYGWAWFFRDVTEHIKQEQKFRNVVEQAANPILILKGEDLVLEVANEALFSLWQVDSKALNKPFVEILPEMKNQGFVDLLLNVLHTGEPFYGKQVPAVFRRKGGVEETVYFDFSYQPYLEADGRITGVLVIATDVSKEVAMKQQLLESESRFRNMVQQAPVAITLTRGHDVVFESINAPLLRLMGKEKEEEVLGKKMVEVMPEVADQPLLAIIKRVVETGEAFSGSEVPVRLRIGERLEQRYFNLSFTPLIEEGAITGVIHLVLDVTEQVIARKKIEDSAKELNKLANAMPQLVWIADAHGTVTFYNDRIGEFAGAKKLDDGSWHWENILVPEDQQPTVDAWQQAVTSGSIYKKEHRLKMRDGSYRWHLSRAYPQKDATGKVINWYGTGTDVHEQKENEEALRQSQARLQAIIETTPECIKIVAPDGTLQFMNAAGLGMVEGEADLLGKACVYDVIAPEYRSSWIKNHKRVSRGENLNWEFDIIGLKGTRRRMETHAAPLLMSGKTYQLAVTRDVTERKKAEEALEQKNAQLLRINNDLDNFVYTASHDLKAPISNIEGLLQALLRNLSPETLASEKVTRISALMQDSVERFKKTIANLTEVVKLQKESSSEFVPVNLAEVVEEVRLDLEQLIQSSGAQLLVDVEDCTTILFSQKNLRSVVYNLLSNAIKYRSPERVPQVEIRCQSTPQFHVLSVQDNGLGMEQQRISQLFTMFKRFHAHVEGTGIGLYMIKKMIDNAGGRIEVESQAGEGTTFRVYFQP